MRKFFLLSYRVRLGTSKTGGFLYDKTLGSAVGGLVHGLVLAS